jgi:hypothetical protein
MQRHLNRAAFLNTAQGVRDGVTTLVELERFENDSQRIGFALRDLRCEDVLARMAVPELDGLESLVALPFSGDARAGTVDAALQVGAEDRAVCRNVGRPAFFWDARGDEECPTSDILIWLVLARGVTAQKRTPQRRRAGALSVSWDRSAYSSLA